MQARLVHWLVKGEPSTNNWLIEHEGASVRLRAGATLSILLGHGWSITSGEKINGNPEILVVGKIGAVDIERRQLEWSRQILESKMKGSMVLVDYTDHHLGFVSPMTAFYKDVLELADVVVCPSGSMKRLLEKHWPGKIEVIEDAIEVEPLAPKREIHQPVTMLWFGHASNISFWRISYETSFLAGGGTGCWL